MSSETQSNQPRLSRRLPSRNSRMTDLPHNPYVGFFHGNYRLLSASQNRVFLPNSSPHVGTFRHAPAHGQRLKDLMWQDDGDVKPFISQLQLAHQNKYADRHITKNGLDEIPITAFTSKKEVSEEDAPMCSICLDAFVDGDEIRNLKCSHCFHRACVDIWLLGTLSDDSVVTSICPTCRQDAGSTSSTASTPTPGGSSSTVGGSGIPAEIYLRIGQHLLEEGAKGYGGTPSPLIMSPCLMSPPLPSPSPRGHARQPLSPAARESPATRPDSTDSRDRASSLSSLSSSSSVCSQACSSCGDQSPIGDVDDVEISFLNISRSDAIGMPGEDCVFIEEDDSCAD